MTAPEGECGEALRALLAHLDEHPDAETWQGWRIERIGGGTNALLYRARGARGDLAVKFTPRDGRDRAGREFAALSVLRQAGLAIAPEPILLDRERYRLPVVVQSWLEGESLTAPPVDDAAWRRLLEHYAAIHTVTPEGTGACLVGAVLSAGSAAACRELVRTQVAVLPAEARPVELQGLLQQWEATPLPAWPPAPRALSRCDANYANLIRRPGAWASVDWENSGWADPAFEIAELITHAAYIGVPAARWDWVVAAYCDLARDPGAAVRIGAYRRTLNVWWVVRLARYLYEVPRGLDCRLVARPAGWEADLRAKYAHYLRLAAGAEVCFPI